MQLTEMLLKKVKNDENYTIEKYEDLGVLLIPPSENSYYMPNVVIKDLEELEAVLQEYASIIRSDSMKFYMLDKNHKIENYLFYLIKSLTNDDCQDFTSYVSRFCHYLTENNFSDLDYCFMLDEINGYKLYARKCEEYYGSETPYTMHFYTEVPGFRFEMPLVRYGIDGDVAYIYSVQRKRIYNNNYVRVKDINHLFNGVNSGVKELRNITPSMLCSLTVFLGMLKAQNITKIRADGFLTRRYGHFYGVENDDQRNQILNNSVDKFFNLFIRVASQFEGIEITAFPFDVDNYIHLSMSEHIYSNNELLNSFFLAGLNYSLSEQEYVKKKEPVM